MFLSFILYNALATNEIPAYSYFGVLFLVGLSALIHRYIYGNEKSDPQKTIRRMMVGSMLRMLAAILFLAITLFAYRPISFPFVISYTGSFFLLMVFEISQIRRKLRPDFNGRSK
jgi:O-antigen/teichoic acid export membrane protein